MSTTIGIPGFSFGLIKQPRLAPAGVRWIIRPRGFVFLRDRKGHRWLYQVKRGKHGAVPEGKKGFHFKSWKPLRCL